MNLINNDGTLNQAAAFTFMADKIDEGLKEQQKAEQLSAAALRWMLFVDGENLARRAKESEKAWGEEGQRLLTSRENPNPYYWPGVFVWFRELWEREDKLIWPKAVVQRRAIRWSYYTSCQGADDVREQAAAALWKLGFEPHVWKRESGTERSKCVDIDMTRDILCHGFRNHYDLAIIVTGDGDFLPVIEEVKRMGKQVGVAALSSGLSPRIHMAGDFFIDLDPFLKRAFPNEAERAQLKAKLEETDRWLEEAQNPKPRVRGLATPKPRRSKP